MFRVKPNRWSNSLCVFVWMFIFLLLPSILRGFFLIGSQDWKIHATHTGLLRLTNIHSYSQTHTHIHTHTSSVAYMRMCVLHSFDFNIVVAIGFYSSSAFCFYFSWSYVYFLLPSQYFVLFSFIFIRFRGAFCCVYSVDDERVEHREKKNRNENFLACTHSLPALLPVYDACFEWDKKAARKRRREKITRKIKSREHNTRTQWILFESQVNRSIFCKYKHVWTNAASHTHIPERCTYKWKRPFCNWVTTKTLNKIEEKKKTKTTSFIAACMFLFFLCSFFLYSTRSRRYNVGQTRIHILASHRLPFGFSIARCCTYKTHNYIENDTDKTSISCILTSIK